MRTDQPFADDEPSFTDERSVEHQCNDSKSAVLQEEIEILRKKIEQQQKQLNELTLRHAAELANLRTRQLQQLESSRKFALEKFLKDILPIVDSLEQAQNASNSLSQDFALNGIQQGIAATLKLSNDFLKTQRVIAIEALNEKFNPLHHHAMNTSENPDFPANHVTHVYQKGYLLFDRLLRPAIVSVNAVAPASTQSDTTVE